MLLDRLDELDLRLHDLRGDRARLVEDLVKRIDACRDQLVSAEDVPPLGRGGRRRARRRARRPTGRGASSRSRASTSCTTAGWPRSGLEDFGLSIVRALELLRVHPDRREAARAGARHVLVDEFQDTNHAQAELLYAVAGGVREPVVVGDDDQGIYRFRGASAKNIARLPPPLPRRRRAAPGAQPPLDAVDPRRRDGGRRARSPTARPSSSVALPDAVGPAAALLARARPRRARPARWSTGSSRWPGRACRSRSRPC